MDKRVTFDAHESKKNDAPKRGLTDEEKAEKLRALLDKAGTKPRKAKNSTGKTIGIVAIIVVFAGLLTFGIWQYTENLRLRSPEAAQEVAQKETEALVTKVSKLIQLPSESPTVATVDDKDKLKDQPFFADAENGDKVLIFSAASKAVIYRESENRIINSGPIAITASPDTEQL